MLSQITRARWIATVLSLKEVQNQFQPLYLTKSTNIKINKLNKTPQNRFTHFRWYILSHIVLVKRVFNYSRPYVQKGTPTFRNISTLKDIALHPYPTLKDYQLFFLIYSHHTLQEDIGYGHTPPDFVILKIIKMRTTFKSLWYIILNTNICYAVYYR